MSEAIGRRGMTIFLDVVAETNASLQFYLKQIAPRGSSKTIRPVEHS